MPAVPQPAPNGTMLPWRSDEGWWIIVSASGPGRSSRSA